jgi:DNA-binding response OmpR family regulator
MPAPVVLIIEDSADLCDLLCIVFEQAGIPARGATRGADALAALRDGLRPVAIVLDYLMPEINGEDVLRYLMQEPALSTIPVILTTGKHLDTVPAGVTHALKKPFEPEALVEFVRAHIARR